MVGVPGKSKGCKTCRQRKIACGLQRPKCAQCIKSNRTCLGYDRNVTFVPVEAKLKEKKLVVTSSFGATSLTPPEATKSNKCTPSSRSLFSTEDSTEESGRRSPLDHQKHDSYTLIPTRLNAAASRQQLHGSFFSTCFPQGAAGIGSSDNAKGGTWLLQLPELLMRIPALEASISAISASVLGRMHDDQYLVNESLKLYTIGLRELQKALWNPKLMYDDETLASCLCLSLYEIVECPGDGSQAYYNHLKGCMRLVEARGIDRHLSGIAHELFLGFRAQGILVCMATHQPTFLSTPLWMDGPFRIQPKRPLDRLVDCLCQAPAIYKDADVVANSGPLKRLEFHLGSIDKCWKMDIILQEVYDDLEKEFSSPMYWSVLATEPNTADDPIRGKVFPVAYNFPNMTVARSLMLYWACRLLVWAGFLFLYRGILELEIEAADARCSNYPDCAMFDDGMCYCRHLVEKPAGCYKFDRSLLKPLDYRTDLRLLIYNVCQSVEYCLKSGLTMFSSWSAGTPLSFVYETTKAFPGFERELAWMEATLRKLQHSGLRIIKYSTTINSPKLQEVTETENNGGSQVRSESGIGLGTASAVGPGFV